MKSPFFYRIVFLLMCSSCTYVENKTVEHNEDPLKSANYILDKKITYEESKAIEKKFNSQIAIDKEIHPFPVNERKTSYRRMSLHDSLAFSVRYSFQWDTLVKAEYVWENLVGKKPQLDQRKTQLVELLQERTGEKGMIDLELRMKDVSRKIDWDDNYYWARDSLRAYSASIYYHESERAGGTVLWLTVEF